MSRIDEAIARARAEARPLFVPFWVLGDPDEETALAVLRALLASGADALELGIPFSDPPADGPVIQAAQARALAAGMTPSRALASIARLRRETDVPIFVMAYANLLASFDDASSDALGEFARAAASAGVDALLVPDAPIEESAPFEHACRGAGVALAQMVTELTPPARLAHIAAHATGYLYVVSRAGTTGTHAGLGERLSRTLARVPAASSLPTLVGFGVSSSDDVAAVARAGATGVIVGSALVREVESGREGLSARVGLRARALRG